MQVPDFWRSFLTFRIDALKRAPTTVSHKPPTTLNNARLQLEARCRITDRESGVTSRYVRSASCKTERVGVARDIWLNPNGDMNMTLSDEDYLDVKAWDVVNKGVTKLYPPSRGAQPDRQIGKIADAFDNTKISLRMVESEELNTADEIIEATLAGDLLVGQVEFSALGQYEVVLDFPIKVINVSRRDATIKLIPAPSSSLIFRLNLATLWKPSAGPTSLLTPRIGLNSLSRFLRRWLMIFLFTIIPGRFAWIR